MFTAHWLPPGGGSVELSPLLGSAHSLYPRGTQLLAALVLPEALWCYHGWFFLWKMPTPQSYGNGEPKGTVVIKWPKEEDPRCQILFSTS